MNDDYRQPEAEQYVPSITTGTKPLTEITDKELRAKWKSCGYEMLVMPAQLRAFYNLAQADRDAELRKQVEAGEVEKYDGDLTVVFAYAYSDKLIPGTKLYSQPMPPDVEAVRDADRYRLLREACTDESILCELDKIDNDPKDPVQFDAAIDTVLAIRANKQG